MQSCAENAIPTLRPLVILVPASKDVHSSKKFLYHKTKNSKNVVHTLNRIHRKCARKNCLL